jgi:hypothetical protein
MGGGFGGASGEQFGQGVQAQGQQREVQRDVQRYDARQQKPADPRAGEQQRQADPRSFDGRAEEPRRVQQNQDQVRDGYRRSHMTPDERRDLRRQINETGQDIYANPPRR